MTMSFKHLHTFPTLIPIPQLNCHIIRGGQNERLRGMNDDGANVIGMGFEGGDLFRSIVIVNS